MKDKGAVPIPYIIALLLGVAVVAILGYWFFVLGGQLGGDITLQKCRSNAQIYCNSWKLLGYRYDSENYVPSVGGYFMDKYPKCEQYAPTLGFTNRADQPTLTMVNSEIDACKSLVGDSVVNTVSNGGTGTGDTDSNSDSSTDNNPILGDDL